MSLSRSLKDVLILFNFVDVYFFDKWKKITLFKGKVFNTNFFNKLFDLKNKQINQTLGLAQPNKKLYNT